MLGASNVNTSIEKNAVSSQSPQATLDSLVTRIAPIQQDYGVGQLNKYSDINDTCILESTPEEASFGFTFGSMRLAWVIWDVTVIPQDAEIVTVEIQHELFPNPYNQEGVRYWYRRLDSIYLTPPDCMIAYLEMRGGLMYLEVEMGDTAGTRCYSLGDSAIVDVANAVMNQNNYSICISFCEWGSGSLPGIASIPGWSVGGPELIVTWRQKVGVSKESWGAIKRMHSR